MIYSINEGQQAEEYKARKAKEAEDAKKKDDEKYYSRHRDSSQMKTMAGYANSKANDPNLTLGDIRKVASKNSKTNATAYNKNVDDERNRRQGDGKPMSYRDQMRAQDAANRHIRRHPKQYKEGTIFESVEFI